LPAAGLAFRWGKSMDRIACYVLFESNRSIEPSFCSFRFRL